ncbi:MAG TPA: hypothetical protein DEH78_06220 [Solibacterales bacterium]|nr:hypothetical protein [Bryobacterales bacterium]
MSDGKNLKDYAGGWIQEREGTEIPGFLKIAFPIIGLFCTAYLVVYMVGEVDHADRGSLVKIFNAATQTSPVLMYVVAALSLLYVVAVAVFAVRKFKED